MDNVSSFYKDRVEEGGRRETEGSVSFSLSLSVSLSLYLSFSLFYSLSFSLPFFFFTFIFSLSLSLSITFFFNLYNFSLILSYDSKLLMHLPHLLFHLLTPLLTLKYHARKYPSKKKKEMGGRKE